MIGRLCNFTKVAQLKELSGKTELDCKSICRDFVDRDDFIYPASSQTKVDNNARKAILTTLSDGKTVKEVAELFGVKATTVYAMRSSKLRPKNSIPSVIKLDYDFGICIGYYASEGNMNQGRACQFSLDGHVDKSLDYFVQQLSTSLFNSIGIYPKCYIKADNTKSLSINSRVFSDVVKYICPGICYNKFVKHDILFSNLDFLRGFIIGVWNGDGHIRKDRASLQMTNENLVNQIRLVLSVFGINVSFHKPKRPETSVIKGKICNLSDAWRIDISGQDFYRFLNTFYNKEASSAINRNLVFSDDEASIYRIKSKELIPYDGLVYNLEVEEDNSYSTPNATVHNCFTTDSNGFFKRSLIESCVTNEQNEVTHLLVLLYLTQWLKAHHLPDILSGSTQLLKLTISL
jgi:hypothetical protein